MVAIRGKVRDMRITALIPARSGSKRIPGKNIKDFCGHPLLAYTIQVAKDSGLFDDIVVSTDKRDTWDIAKKHGARYHVRLEEHGQDTSPDIDWIKDALSKIDDKPDIIVIIRPTNPFRTVKMLVRSMIQFLQSDCDSMRAVEPVKQHPYKMWNLRPVGDLRPMHNIDGGDFALPTQSLPQLYVQNASLEIIWTKTIELFDNVYGDTIMPYFTEGYEGYDINTPEDWILAEELVKRGMVKLPEVK